MFRYPWSIAKLPETFLPGSTSEVTSGQKVICTLSPMCKPLYNVALGPT